MNSLPVATPKCKNKEVMLSLTLDSEVHCVSRVLLLFRSLKIKCPTAGTFRKSVIIVKRTNVNKSVILFVLLELQPSYIGTCVKQT